MNKEKLYTVYHNNPECPEKIFETFDEDKAKSFCEEYNKVNNINKENTWTSDRMDYYELDLNKIEKEADSTIQQYMLKKKVCFICDFETNEFQVYYIVNKVCKKDNLLIEEDIFINNSKQEEHKLYSIILIFDLDYPIDFNDKTIIRRLKKKYNKWKRLRDEYNN